MIEEMEQLNKFQPTLPVRGATLYTAIRDATEKISTHAPRAGSDSAATHQRSKNHTFQPTLPVRGATASTNKFEALILYHKYNFGIIP